MKVLITGASGFIGNPLTTLCLEKGWDVVGVSRTKSTFSHKQYRHLAKDIQLLNESDLKNIDAVIHLAPSTPTALSVSNPEETTKTNVGMTVHLLALASKVGVTKFVFPSTASIYGRNPTPWREDAVPDPLEPYSWVKLSCEYALKMWKVRYGLSTVTLRIALVFGDHYRADSVFSHFFKAKKENKPLTVTKEESADGVAMRDFVYEEDVARAFVAAVESPKVGNGEVINIASGYATSLEEVAKVFSNNIEYRTPHEFEVLHHRADITLAKELLGWEPQVEILPWLRTFMKGF